MYNKHRHPNKQEPSDLNLIYGRHALFEALKTEQTFEKIFLLNYQKPFAELQEIKQLAQRASIPIVFAPREKLDRISQGSNHQGIIGILSSQDYADIEEIISTAITKKSVILILDHIEDPHNIGSLLRTCDATGVAGVVIPKRRAVGLTGGTAKASAGAIQHVPVAKVPNLHQVLLRLRKEGVTILGADQAATKNFHEMNYEPPLAIVLGSEHQGISLLLKNTCDTLVKIPMKGHLDSLNVSVAGALILYQAFLQNK